MEIRDIAEQVKNTQFLNDLLEEFVIRGLGSLPGRETTIALVKLLLDHHPDWKENPPADYEIARLLRTSPRKIRNIRDEIGYRDTKRDDDWCKKQLKEEVLRAERVQDGNYVTFQIDDGLVRDYARKLVRDNYGVFESGLNTAIVKISGQAFIALALSVIPDSDKDTLLASLPKEIEDTHQDERIEKNPIRLFVESFADSAGKEAGKQTIDLAFTVLTGGTNQISKAVNMIKNLFDGK